MVGVLQRQPGKIRAGNKHIDHGPIAAMQDILQTLVRRLPAECGPSVIIFRWSEKENSVESGTG